MIDRKLKFEELKPNNVTPISVEMVSVPNATNYSASPSKFPLNEFLYEEKGRLKVWFGLDVNDLRRLAHVKVKAFEGKTHPIFRGQVDPLVFLNLAITQDKDFPIFCGAIIDLVQDIAYRLAVVAYRHRWNEQFYLDNKKKIDAEAEQAAKERAEREASGDAVYSHHDGYVGD